MKNKVLAILLVLAMCLSMLPMSVFAADSPLSYVALGDSISTGYGLAGYEVGTLPTNSFTHLLANELGVDLTNLAIDGNTAAGILAQLGTDAVKAAVTNADLITITAGGNDLMDLLYQAIADQYNASQTDSSKHITADQVPAIFMDASDSRRMNLMNYAMGLLNPEADIYLIDDPEFTEAVDAYIGVLNQVTAAILAENPDATILVATQYNPYVEFNGALYASIINLTPIYAGMEAGVTALNTAIKNNAATGNYIVADVKAAFDAYTGTEDLYNADPASLNIDFHPTAAGHAIIAETFGAAVPEPPASVTVETPYDNTVFSSVTGGGTYAYGETVTLTATVNTGATGSVFHYWLDNSVPLSANPTEAELKAAIVSYSPTFTFTARENASYTPVGDYTANTPYIYVDGYLFGGADYTMDGEGWGFTGDYDYALEIGKEAVTATMDNFPASLTIDGQLYLRGSMIKLKGETADGEAAFEEIPGGSITVPVAPVFNSVEYWAWLNNYVSVIVAYHPHTHAYQAATCEAPATCSCGDTTGDIDPANHAGGTEVRNQKDATEFEAGYTGDTYCLGCDTMLEQGTTIPATHVHSYSTATCETPATCSCGATTGGVDSTNHTGGTEVRNQKDATEFEDGYTGDTFCLGCDTKLADGETIPATHTHSYTQKHNSTTHWKECSCGDIKDAGAHSLAYQYVDTSTHERVCTDCGFIASTDAHKASGIYATNSTEHWIRCSTCSSDIVASHVYTDTYDSGCNVCYYDRGTSCTHAFGEYSITVTSHERACEKCGLAVREEHFADTYKVIDGAAHTEICVCGKSWDAVHTWEQTSGHAAKCLLCGAESGHIYTVFKPSEANPEGYHVAHCSVCGKMSDPVQAGDHTYEEQYGPAEHWDQCTVCGHITRKTAHQMTVDPYDGDSTSHIVYCADCTYARFENCVFEKYVGNADGHWLACFACGETHSGIKLEAHVDAQPDEQCDVCSENIAHQHSYTYTPHEIAANVHDGVCDCGATLTASHVDNDNNFSCDDCKAFLLVWPTMGMLTAYTPAPGQPSQNIGSEDIVPSADQLTTVLQGTVTGNTVNYSADTALGGVTLTGGKTYNFDVVLSYNIHIDDPYGTLTLSASGLSAYGTNTRFVAAHILSDGSVQYAPAILDGDTISSTLLITETSPFILLAITEVETNASDSPPTGDTAIWRYMLVTVTAGAILTLTVYDRKQRYAGNNK